MGWTWALGCAIVAIAVSLISTLLAERAHLMSTNAFLFGAVHSLETDVRRNLDHTLRLMQPLSCEASDAAQAPSSEFSELTTSIRDEASRCRPGGQYTVAAVLSGRRDRMRLLLPYLDSLLGSQLDEVHLWDYSRTPEDSAWVRRVAVRHGYRAFHVERPDNRHLEVYDFYGWGPAPSPSLRFQPACPESTPNSTVIVKIDDDVVFVNTSVFPLFVEFVRKRPDMLAVHANVINNGVAAFYQSQMLPHLRHELPALAVYPSSHWRQGLGGALVYDTAVALRLHQLFAEGPGLFAWDDPARNHCIIFRAPEGVGSVGLGQGQFSVHFFGSLWSAWHTLRNLVRCVDIDYDEPAVTVLATRLGHTECMFTPLNVAHLGFGSQDDASLLSGALPLYEDLLARQDLARSRADLAAPAT